MIILAILIILSDMKISAVHKISVYYIVGITLNKKIAIAVEYIIDYYLWLTAAAMPKLFRSMY